MSVDQVVLAAPGREGVARAPGGRAPRGPPLGAGVGRAVDTARRYDGYTVVVNGEPCSMCAWAMVRAAPSTLVFGARHEPHMDPDLAVADVFARARRPPRLVAGIIAAESAAQIA